jgi:mannose-6-phosphate isomerase-like protein (cupin superfamily)
MTGELGISLDDLLFLEAEATAASDGADGTSSQPLVIRGASAGPVQRSGDRKTIRLASGVVWERLTTTSEPEIEFLKVTYEVGGASSPESEFQRHGGHEWGFVLSGTLGVTIGFEDYTLGPGDSISIDSTTPHRLYNRGNEPVHGIWFALGRRSMELPSDRPFTARSNLDDR